MLSVQQAPTHKTCLTKFFFTYTNLKFFSRMRRLLNKLHHPKSQTEKPRDHTSTTHTYNKEAKTDIQEEMKGDTYNDDDKWVKELRRAVTKLHFGISWEEKEAAVKEIERMAKVDLKRRKIMAELGVIPVLVDMVGEDVAARRSLAVRALTHLANGSFTNKALMVEAGILSKLPENMAVLDEPAMHELAQLLLSISALANSQFSLTSVTSIPTTLSILDSSSSNETNELCLRTLHNLSSVLENSGTLTTNGVVDTLLKYSTVKEAAASEKALATLGNLVVTLTGRKSIEHNLTVPDGLIEIMTWDDKPKCQELSAYILMILAHQSSLQRRKMSEAGIVQVLLEVALLGSPLAQKRALKILQWFKDERQMRVGPHSGPLVETVLIGSPVHERDVDEGKKLMKKIVKQSLYKNMETITRRANGDEGCSNLKALVISSSSKSLPY